MKPALKILALVAALAVALPSLWLWEVNREGRAIFGGALKGGAFYRCPPNMALVYDLRDLTSAYCVDRYEGRIDGELGSPDQFSAGAVPTTGQVVSLPGILPSPATSFDMARAACRNTPVVDSAGKTVGTKRLLTSREWQDAADGRVGPGGFRWPYGNAFDEGRCVSLKANGEPQYEDVLPTASKPGCVSAFGIYDLSGNVWEWADPGLTLDVDRWFKDAAAAGVAVSPDEGGLLKLGDRGGLARLSMTIVGVLEGALTVDGAGLLTIPGGELPPSWLNGPPAYRGYLVLAGKDLALGEGFLPVEIRREALTPDSPAHLLLLREHDGAPVTDKRGGAYYTGHALANSTYERYLGHFHDFTGTIGVRCGCLPLVTTLF